MNSSSSLLRKFSKTLQVTSGLWLRNLVCCYFSIVLIFAFSSALNAQSANTVVARIHDQAITLEDVDQSVVSQVYALQQQLFAIRKVALDNLVTRKLLEEEAKRQRLSIDQLKSKWMTGPIIVEPAQVDDLYRKNIAAFGLMSPDEAREKLRLDLENQVRLRRYRDELGALRQRTNVEIFLAEPRISLTLNSDTASTRGPANAKVTITEFSDFQCPYCKEAQSILARVLEKYASEVKLQFKHLPLQSHPFALTAARGAYCAGKQGAFWKFHDGLFESAQQLSPTLVRSIALNLKLNLEDFETCLSSQNSLDAVSSDLLEAQRIGINGTPSFVINGKLLLGIPSIEDFDTAIRRELDRASTSKPQSLQ